MILSFRYRLLPTKKQHRALESILEAQRLLYNAALEERIDAYRKRGISRTYIDQTKSLTQWRQEDPEGRSLPANLQRATLKRLDMAYAGYFRRVKADEKPGFPRFRGKGRFRSFGFREFSGLTWKNWRLRFKGLPGALRVHLHRPLPADAVITGCNFRRDINGWFIGFVVAVKPAAERVGQRSVGLDLGVNTFAALSDGGFIPSLKAARKAERRLRVNQRALSRKKNGSKGRSKARSEVGRCYAAIVRRRSDYLHQASSRLVRDYDVIAFEALNVKGMARTRLAKDIYDASWTKFIAMLTYKAAKAGARVIAVNPMNTTQACSACGDKVPKGRDTRWHVCVHCGLSIDRDLNAARNILDRAGVGPGLRNVAGCGMRAGEILSPALQADSARRWSESLPTSSRSTL